MSGPREVGAKRLMAPLWPEEDGRSCHEVAGRVPQSHSQHSALRTDQWGLISAQWSEAGYEVYCILSSEAPSANANQPKEK